MSRTLCHPKCIVCRGEHGNLSPVIIVKRGGTRKGGGK